MHIFICDDNDRIAQSIQEIIQTHSPIKNLDIHLYSNPDQMLSEVDNHTVPVPHLVFMDIELGERNGIAAAARLQSRNQKIGIVFVTAYEKKYSEMIFDGVVPSGFIRKPVSVEMVMKAVNKVYARFINAEKTVTISTTLGEITVPLSNLHYIESRGRNLEYHIGTDVFISASRMADAIANLPKGFVQCHRAYIVNLSSVIEMDTEQFILLTGEQISIGRKYREIARERYFAFKGMSYASK